MFWAVRSFEHKLSSLYFSRAQAAGADVHSLVCAVYNSLYLSYVRLPGSVGLAVGMGNVKTKNNALSADITLCHYRTPPSFIYENIKFHSFRKLIPNEYITVFLKMQ